MRREEMKKNIDILRYVVASDGIVLDNFRGAIN